MTNLHAVRHFFAFTRNIRSRLALIRTSRKTDFRLRNIAKNNFTGIDIPQGLDLEPASLSPYLLLIRFIHRATDITRRFELPKVQTHIAQK